MNTQIKRRLMENIDTVEDSGKKKCLVCENFSFINTAPVSRFPNSCIAEETKNMKYGNLICKQF